MEGEELKNCECGGRSEQYPIIFFLSQNISTQRYNICNMQPPPCGTNVCKWALCTVHHNLALVMLWGAYDIWVFRGSRSGPQWGVVHHSYVLLVCRKFWFLASLSSPLTPGRLAAAATCCPATPGCPTAATTGATTGAQPISYQLAVAATNRNGSAGRYVSFPDRVRDGLLRTLRRRGRQRSPTAG
jgi:hypothetical protein